jgi:hypothetical protein
MDGACGKRVATGGHLLLAILCLAVLGARTDALATGVPSNITTATVWTAASPLFALGPGISRSSFTGQHGVDLDGFVIAQRAREALLGNWADTWTQPRVPKWEERQHILRVRGTGPFHRTLAPYCAGHRPVDMELDVADGGFVLTADRARRELPQRETALIMACAGRAHR